MFRIGDFSKIAQVSGRLLRYYDEIGLLGPEFTDPQTGYRYYSARQLPRLNRILVNLIQRTTCWSKFNCQ
jgi:DNA-binding transcriptional MerR regulator